MLPVNKTVGLIFWCRVCVVLLGASAYAGSVSVPPVFSEGAQTYRMRYEMDLHFSKAVSPEQIENKVIRHTTFLIGNMAWIKDAENEYATGAPLRVKSDIKISNIALAADGGSDVHYIYDGRVVLTRKNLSTYTAYLPSNLEALDGAEIYSAGACSIYGSGGVSTVDVLAVYWNPFISRRCTVPYAEVKATLTPVEDTQKAPEYARLVHDGVISVAFYFGKMDQGSSNNPYSGGDGSAGEYQTVQNHMRRMGLRTISIIKNAGQSSPYQEQMEGQFGSIKIKIKFVYGDSVYKESSMNAFNALYTQSANTDSVVLYSGHSGFLVDASTLKIYDDMPVALPQTQYQIFGFNGCQTNYYTYPLYLQKSAKDLDVFVNARESLANAAFGNVLLDSVIKWAAGGAVTPFQELVDRMDAVGALTGVIGDQE